MTIVEQAIPVDEVNGTASSQRLISLQAAALPVIIRELLDVDVDWLAAPGLVVRRRSE